MELQIKRQKWEEIAYLQANKQETRCRLTYSEISKKEEKYDSYFDGQKTAWKEYVRILVVINKKIKVRLTCSEGKLQQDIGTVDGFPS